MTMQQSQWAGVFPAITTPFRDDLSVDHDALAEHVRWLADAGCAGIVTGGSLGEAATLSFDEKVRINETCVRAIDGRIPVVAGIAGLATAECVALARAAERAGCEGIMALPAYVYYSDWRETREHYGAIIADLVTGREPAIDATAFAPTRYTSSDSLRATPGSPRPTSA